MCKKVGILACATFMLGNPTETKEDIKLTMQFIKENSLDGVGVHITTPFPLKIIFSPTKVFTTLKKLKLRYFSK